MRHRGGAPNAGVIAIFARERKKRAPRAPRPVYPLFTSEELAFFWSPRAWVPDIRDRFSEGRPGSSDIRDAIIDADDEGGKGHLHWFKDVASWGLTDAGKRLVTAKVRPGKIRAQRDWKSPRLVGMDTGPGPDFTVAVFARANEILEVVAIKDPILFIPVMFDAALEEGATPPESGEDELARLVLEQASDKDSNGGGD